IRCCHGYWKHYAIDDGRCSLLLISLLASSSFCGGVPIPGTEFSNGCLYFLKNLYILDPAAEKEFAWRITAGGNVIRKCIIAIDTKIICAMAITIQHDGIPSLFSSFTCVCMQS